MINYSITNFFNKVECDYLIDTAKLIGIPFKYNPEENWDCRRIYDESFKNKILEKLKSKYVNGEWKIWKKFDELDIKSLNISLTTYENNRYLNLHLDKSSILTIVIVLNNNFEDGRFAITHQPKNNFHFETLENLSLIHLNSGEGITFEGNKIYHGVLPVNIGVRYALNIWLSDEADKYFPIKDLKSLI